MMRVLLALLLAFGVAMAVSAQVTSPAATSAAPPTSAAPANPYSATVPVAGTSGAQRNAAIGAALAQVLQQVSLGFTAGPDVLAQAPGYVRTFHYRRAASGAGLELQVEFDPGAVTRLLNQAATTGAGTIAGTATPASGMSAAAPAAQGGSGTLWVGGVANSHAFASLLSTLRGDPDLSNVTPIEADGEGVLLQLTFDQPLATVIANLGGPTGHLAPAPQPHAGANASVQWVP
ncbi:MAG: DUF2066 domain-containing protein [Rhodanobacteraceae bacterium]